MRSLEVMGRDSSIVSTHPKAQSVNIRSIIDSDIKVDPTLNVVKFNLKPNKVFLFRKDDETRIYLNEE